jgi:hypothetical protein
MRHDLIRRRLGGVVVVLLVSLFAAQVTAQIKPAPPLVPEPKQDTWSFSAKGDTERVRLVDIRLFETVYAEGFVLDLDGKAANALPADEDFIRRFFVVNAGGTPDEILDLWPESERQAIRKMAENESLVRASRAYYSRVKRVRLVRKVYYGSYRFVLVDVINGASTGSRSDVYVLRHVDDKVYVTNSLQNDPAGMFIEQILRTGLPPSAVK